MNSLAGEHSGQLVEGITKMGMDVHGVNPTSKEGQYFRASIWSWPPIHALIIELCGDLLTPELLTSLGYNNGAGPEDAETCIQMADRFEEWLSKNSSGYRVVVDREAGSHLKLLEAIKQLAPDRIEIVHVGGHYASNEHLAEWVDFLRSCGGFKVY